MCSFSLAYLYHFSIKLVVNQITGKSNSYADILSRWDSYKMLDNPYVKIIKNVFGVTQKYRICFQTLTFDDT